MTFLIKQKYVAPHHCNTPPNTQNNPLVPGDLWECDDCGRKAVWAHVYGQDEWSYVTETYAAKILKRHHQGKPFRREHDRGTGPG